MKKLLQHTPVFLFLLPVFFVLHGVNENFGYINVPDCLLLMITYTGAAALLYFLFLPFLKNYVRAALMATYLMAFYCFFGAVHDFFKLQLGFFYRYVYLLPVFLILGLLLLAFLKRTTHPFIKLSLFINLLLIIYLVVDSGGIVWKLIYPPPNKLAVYSFAEHNNYVACNGCSKPDIYFLLFDEYASSLSLKQRYHYDNSDLDSFLTNSGFHIQTKSRSNYNFTPFSMSSILNMSYLHGFFNPAACSADDYAYCNNLIKNDQVIKFLSYQGYDIVNYSVFDLAGNPSRVNQTFLPLKTKLITDRTLFAYLRKDIGWMFYAGKWEIKWLTENTFFNQVVNNDKIIAGVETESEAHPKHPRFIYAHIYMPHPPFFFDKNGVRKDKATIYQESVINKFIQPYLDYIPYTNSRVKELISAIQTNTRDSAVIIFMGDHGFRYETKEVYPIHFFQNQNAVFFPDKDYHLLYDSITGVNMFRVVFNKMFDQHIPLLQDSSIFLRDKQ
jgi:hypothetical protein